MSYEISVSDDHQYAICRVHVPITVEFAREFGKAVETFCRERGLVRRLIDVRSCRNVESVHSNYDFAYTDMQKMEIDQGSRYAVLVAPDDRTHDFPVIVMKNAGYNMKLFCDESQAIEWLLQDR